MKHILMGASLLALSAGAVSAGGIERSTQSVGVLFEKGKNYVELSYGRIRPSVDGVGVITGQDTGGVARNHYLPGFAYKHEFNDKLSMALMYDHFYGANIEYPTSGALEFAGTHVNVQSEGYTALLRYKFDENWSVHGGVRLSDASAVIGLNGLAYGPASGYLAHFANDWAMGYSLGAAYEKPEIALRVALTYQSKVTHKFDTTEQGFGETATGTTEVDTPEAVTLDFQTGVAPDWLVFGSVRWVHWTQFQIDPALFTAATGGGLVNLNNSTSYTLGVGHKFTDAWSGSAFLMYEGGGGDDKLVSPLAPTRGYKGIGLAAVYTHENVKVTGAVRYLWLGDADAQTAGVARANFTDNHAVAAGVRVGITF
ncbi:hypothetical protein EOW65_17235 [Sinirhodobacter ferrireducens]|uniref:Aromatic hydrocarbon degradation protein n=1 Tax=Paenirhodobacter ferrireducens TaxID=1215032 RepID=A0A443L7B0_9RHOB|nr:outer membrane protein transport protein [Sinirhodobacter ferrireducens]RWR45089.1 hypothetical protein EOW65_17235 [Sinirhodobacter ferrireducens]